MLKLSQILVRPVIATTCMVILGACGQKGDLYHPTEPAAAKRATLPQTLTPDVLKPAEKPASAP